MPDDSMPLSVDAVLSLAPDPASAKAARGLVSPAQWPTLGVNDAAVWGECQGSGAKPYQTQVDLAGPAFRCSCPSRKFPCKHGLALMLLRAEQGTLFKIGDAPAWVSEWLASRVDKAQKKEEREQTRAAAPADAEAAATRERQREAQRWARIEGSAQELQRWLADQIGTGLGVRSPAQRAVWQTMAARLVDAQAPGLGQRLREATEGLGQGADWPERTLRRLGLLQLACDAISRRETLPEDVQADLRLLVGWPIDKAEVLATGPRVRDHWTVLGVAAEERDDKLTERRAWLQGERSGRRALLLDHAHGGRGFDQPWFAGTGLEATLVGFPGASAQRALVDEPGPLASDPVWPTTTVAQEWASVAARVAACPWVSLHPMVLPGLVPLQADGAWWGVAEGRAWPLAANPAVGWSLLAHAGGAPLTLMGEWDGERLRPLTAWGAQGLWQWSTGE